MQSPKSRHFPLVPLHSPAAKGRLSGPSLIAAASAHVSPRSVKIAWGVSVHVSRHGGGFEGGGGGERGGGGGGGGDGGGGGGE
eukprot:scaffold9077_cov39-Phaeocystis_antarctica.AAC.1